MDTDGMHDTHEVLESYLKNSSIVQQQIDSYNRFLHIGLPKLIESQSLIEPDVPNFSVKLLGIRIGNPVVIESDSSTKPIMPNEALARNMTYAAPLYITYVPVIQGIEKRDSYDEIFIGELPVMIKSDLCYTKNMTKEQLISEGEDPDDPGGYFIIKGTERVLIGVEDLAPNRIICTKEKGKGTVSKVFSTRYGFRTKCSVTRDSYGVYTLLFPTLTKSIDLMLVLKALGFTNEMIMEHIGSKAVKNDMLLNMDLSAAKDISTKDAIFEIGKMAAPNQAREYQIKRAQQQLDTFILPHIGADERVREEKARYLIRMAERASLVAYGKIKGDDKDHYKNKRIKLAGDLMEELFNHALKFFVRDVKYHIERTVARGRKLTFRTAINPDTITDKILSAMGTGSWPAGQSGVSQVLDRVDFLATLSHLRRVKSPLAKKRQHFKARDVHGTHFGKLCPSETPEGIEVGLTRYLALMARVTVGADEQMFKEKLKELQLIGVWLEPEDEKSADKIKKQVEKEKEKEAKKEEKAAQASSTK